MKNNVLFAEIMGEVQSYKDKIDEVVGPTDYAWDKLDAETDKNYEYFLHFLKLPHKERNMRDAVNSYRRVNGQEEKDSVPGAWIEARKRYRWTSRAREFDAFISGELNSYIEEDHLLALLSFKREQSNLSAKVLDAAFKMIEKAMERLENMDSNDIRASTLPGYLATAASIAKIGSDLQAGSISVGKILEMVNESGGVETNNWEADEDILASFEAQQLDGIDGLD